MNKTLGSVTIFRSGRILRVGLLVALCVLSTGRADTTRVTTSTPSTAPAHPTGIQGVWVWRKQYVRDADQRKEMLRFCARRGFNRLLIQVHMKQGETGPTFRYPRALTKLLAAAAKRGIRVEALDGAPGMASAKRRNHPLAKLDAILKFNQTLPPNERYVGVHYDIEPYALPGWKQGGAKREKIMRDLLDFYSRVRDTLDQRAPRMTLAADIPFWYDRKVKPDDSCMLRYRGTRKNLHKHIQDICDYVGIMSYRRKATGPNSVTALVREELAYAGSIDKTICPALDVIKNAKPPKISFFGTSPAEFWKQHNRVREVLADKPGFGGMLTHSYHWLHQFLTPSADHDESSRSGGGP